MKDEERGHRGHGSDACPLRLVSGELAPHPLEGVCRSFYEIAAHVERWVGPIEHVHHDLASEHVHIDVFHVPPNPKREFHTLVTAGMSARPMKPPAEAAECRLVELVLTLPRDWSAGPAMYGSAAHAWPLEGMIDLARLPHASGEWIWGGHSVADADPRPFHSSTALCAWLVACPMGLPAEFHFLRLPDGERIAFFALLPLYREELALKLHAGVDALLDRFRARRLSDVIDPKRPNLASRIRSVRPPRRWR